uniref:Conserved hypothetical plastid protein n=1 Tax=Olisthodiscus luteus TaxID=83000 RepID=A0A7U0KSC7_OLILU|nr:conserved hypothetical plastid protein [Olisthodiscus luteus]QQW50482.1 conserved hypothetical plastid protein [Olisthodiscus luteus]
MINYYFTVMNKNLIAGEPLEEIFRERTQFYLYSNKQIDFWILPNTNILNLNQKNDIKVYNIKNSKILLYKDLTEIKSNSDSLVIFSTKKTFIFWLSLRFRINLIGFFEKINNK